MKFIYILLLSVFLLLSCGKKSDPEFRGTLTIEIYKNV